MLRNLTGSPFAALRTCGESLWCSGGFGWGYSDKVPTATGKAPVRKRKEEDTFFNTSSSTQLSTQTYAENEEEGAKTCSKTAPQEKMLLLLLLQLRKIHQLQQSEQIL